MQDRISNTTMGEGKFLKVTTITIEDLQNMGRREGLVLQGCGGNPNDWINGVNDIFTQEGILEKGTKFERAFRFRYGQLICLLFPFEGVKLNQERLDLWSQGTYEIFGGMRLSDFLSSHLQQPAEDASVGASKSDCALIGKNGNIYNLVGIAARTLKEHHLEKQAEEMMNRVFASDSYEKALSIISEYVHIVGEEPVPEHRREPAKRPKNREPYRNPRRIK